MEKNLIIVLKEKSYPSLWGKNSVYKKLKTYMQRRTYNVLKKKQCLKLKVKLIHKKS